MTTTNTTTGDSSTAATGQGTPARQTYDTARTAVGNNVGPLAEKAKSFAKERPFAAAALAGVVGIAILNTLRGR